MTAAQTLLWETAGRPSVPGAKAKLLQEHPAVCAITGERVDVSADLRKALGENFTDHTLWNSPSGRVGHAALWCCSGKGALSPRTWTWVCAPGVELPPSHEKAPYSAPGLCLTNRANTRPVIDILGDPPPGEWVCAVAVSGQKHVLPYAVTNRGAGRWRVRMEDTTICATPHEWRRVFGLVVALRRLGVPADAVKQAVPAGVKTAEALREWRRLADALRPWASSPLTDLALWCATKPILEDTDGYPNP